MQKIGIIGHGQFGQFLKTQLEKYFEVIFIDTRKDDLNIIFNDLSYVVLSVPVQKLESALLSLKDKIKKETILVDVSSVKVLPKNLIEKYLPNNSYILTHPIFGPQSGKNSIEGLKIVLCEYNFENDKYKEIKKFLSEVLKLKIIEKTSLDHDREMAYVQGLSHFIGRAFKMMNIESLETSTKSYDHLVELENLVGNDSLELYKTIQNGNEFTKEVREGFLKKLKELQDLLD